MELDQPSLDELRDNAKPEKPASSDWLRNLAQALDGLATACRGLATIKEAWSAQQRVKS